MSSRPSIRDAALVIGFETSVAMWALGFAGRLSPSAVPGPLLAAAMIACLVGAGIRAGRAAELGVRAGALAATVASLVNLLILGSLLGGDQPNRVAATALLWIPGSILFGALCGAAGAAASGAAGGRRAVPRPASSWTSELAGTAVAATICLVAIGGLVTSHEAGLAVVDWPNSYGYGMFLYPLSRMTGGIYYEHAHRLFGSLVGLATLVLCVRLLVVERRRGLRGLGVAALVLVIGQGILGGLRVTGHFTWSDDPSFTRPSLLLATVHGFVGQLFLVLLAALAVLTIPPRPEGRMVRAPARLLAPELFPILATIGALLVQLGLGIRVRHLGGGVALHVVGAVAVISLITWSAAKAIGTPRRAPAVFASGAVLLALGWLQVILGMSTLIAVGMRATSGPPALGEVALATLHQTIGAILLAVATVHFLLRRRDPVESPGAEVAIPGADGESPMAPATLESGVGKSAAS